MKNRREKADCTPEVTTFEEKQMLSRSMFNDNGRMIVKTSLIELQASTQEAQYTFEDQPELRDYHVWWIDFCAFNGQMQVAPSGNPVVSIGQMIAAGVMFEALDYNGYSILDNKIAVTLLGYSRKVNNLNRNSLVGQCIDWTKTNINVVDPTQLPMGDFSFLINVGYSYYLDWRLDPLSSFQKKK